MEHRRIPADLCTPRIGCGCWGMSDAYGPADEEESIATIEAALAAGVRHFDTADVYGDGHNETLLGRVLAGRRQDVFLATKFGFVGDEHGQVRVDGRPERVQRACEASLRRLGTEVIDLYYLHRRDESVAIEETVGALDIQLTPEDLAQLATISDAVQGPRHNQHNLAFIEDP